MKSILFCLFLFSISLNAQVQLGNDLDGEFAGDQSGLAVALSADGNRVAIGSPQNNDGASMGGQVRVYDYDNGAWIQVGSDIEGNQAEAFTGRSLSLSADGKRLAVGTVKPDVLVYEFDGNEWVSISEDLVIDVPGPNHLLGFEVSLSGDGNRLGIGIPSPDFEPGSARVYSYDGTAWAQLGSDMQCIACGNWFGSNVALSSDGNRFVVSAFYNPMDDDNRGMVQVYTLNDNDWEQLGSTLMGTMDEQLGRDLAISSDGQRIAMASGGAIIDDQQTGGITVVDWVNNEWDAAGTPLQGESGSGFGWTIGLSGDGQRLLAGVPFISATGNNQGQTEVFTFENEEWVALGNAIPGEATGDFSGYAVALSSNGERVAIGAQRNTDAGFDAGHVRVFDLSNTSVATLGLNEITPLRLFPNPSSDEINLPLTDHEPKIIQIINPQGQIVKRLQTTLNRIDISDLPNGLYSFYLQVNSQHYSGNFTKQ